MSKNNCFYSHFLVWALIFLWAAPAFTQDSGNYLEMSEFSQVNGYVLRMVASNLDYDAYSLKTHEGLFKVFLWNDSIFEFEERTGILGVFPHHYSIGTWKLQKDTLFLKSDSQQAWRLNLHPNGLTEEDYIFFNKNRMLITRDDCQELVWIKGWENP